MSVIDKVVAAITPPESDEARREAREQARSLASPGDWLELALEHHQQIEAAIASVRAAPGEAERRAALRAFGVVLTGHANAEESVLYPALASAEEKGHAGMGYTEQAATKIQMGLLESLPPMSQEFLDKLEHIRGALAHHMYQEEAKWFRELKEKVPDQDRLTLRYSEEFERYISGAEDLADEGSLAAQAPGLSRRDPSGAALR